MNKLNKKLFVTIGMCTIAFSPIIVATSCGDDSPTMTEKNITGNDVLTIDLSNATQAQAQAILTKQAELDKIPGKHYSLTITSKSTPSKTASMVYAYKTIAEGYDVNAKDPRSNSLEASNTGYKGYDHKINGVSWKHTMDYYPLHTELSRVADGTYGYTNITGNDVIAINLASTTPEQAAAKIRQLEILARTPGKHFAVTISNTNSSATKVYAVKSNDEGYVDDVSNEPSVLDRKLVDIDENGLYIGYKHRINGVDWVPEPSKYNLLLNELLAIGGEDTLPVSPEEPSDPSVVERVLTANEIIDVTIPLSGTVTVEEKIVLEEAVHKHNGWYSTTGSANAGRHWAVRITKGNEVAIMVYAYKTIAEGWLSNSDNLLEFDGTQYAGYDHKIDGQSWHHGFSYYELWRQAKNLAATNIRSTDIQVRALSTMSASDAQALIDERNRRLKIESDIFAIALKPTPTSATSTMAYVVKTSEQGFVANPTTEEQYQANFDKTTKKYIRLQFVTDGNYADWKYDVTFEDLWAQVVAKATTQRTI